MKKNNLIKFSLFSLLVLTCSSCTFIDKIISEIEKFNSSVEQENKGSIFQESVDYNDGTYPNSIKLLDKAFNRNQNEDNSFDLDYSNFENIDGTYQYQVTKNIKSLPYNNYTTPSIGNLRSLVIPIEFNDCKAKIIKDEDVTLDENSISVASYYYNSSYGKLNMKFDIMNWYTCKYSSSYYKNYRKKDSNNETDGVDLIIDEVLTYLDKNYDLSIYDSNNDNIIDSIYIIYSKEYNAKDNFWWAYQYYDSDNNFYDGKTPYSYIFASYDFLFENNDKCNTATYIHETGHLLGLEDYYDYDTTTSGCNVGGLGGADMMDSNIGDHNTFSKLLTGWIDKPLIVNTNESVTINLKPSAISDQCVILANNFDDEKGIFQEYFLIEYYVNKGNNEKLKIYNTSGIRIFHINATLKTFTSDNYSYEYFAYDNSYTDYNLIDIIIDSSGNTYSRSISSYTTYEDSDLFTKYETLNNVFYDGYKKTIFGTSGEKLKYNVEVNDLNENYATITITKK